MHHSDLDVVAAGRACPERQAVGCVGGQSQPILIELAAHALDGVAQMGGGSRLAGGVDGGDDLMACPAVAAALKVAVDNHLRAARRLALDGDDGEGRDQQGCQPAES